MLTLDATTASLEVVLAGAITTNQLPIVSSWADKSATAFTPGKTTTQTNSTSTVTIVAAPAALTQREVHSINIYNADTVAATITVRENDNGTLRILVKIALAVGDNLSFTHAQGWRVIDSSGNIKMTVSAFTGVLAATQGGTGFSSYSVGDILYANTTTTLAKLADVAAGSYLRSGGVNTAPVWSTTTLPNSATTGDLLYASASNVYSNLAVGTATQVLQGGSIPTWKSTIDISGASGGQIAFPATQNPSAGANVLDDYEEGTFTVTASASSSGTITLDLATCTYTKVGRNVNVYGIIRVSAISAPTGIMHLNGLPFTIGDWAGLAVYADALAATAITQVMGYFEPATTRIGLFKYSAGATTGLADNVAVNSVFMLAGSYRV